MSNKFNRNRFVQGRGRKVALRDGQYTIFFDEDTGFWMTDMGNGPITLQEAFGVADTNNFAGLADPGANDDSDDGYEVGSLWFNSVSKEWFRCVNATVAAAEWEHTTFDGAEAQVLINAAIAADSAPYDAGNTGSDIDLDRADGRFQKIELTGATVARVLNPPTNGAEGSILNVRVKSELGVARTFDVHASILTPSLSGLALPIALTAGETYKVQLRHNGTAWELEAFIGGYAA